jgi:pantoate--beta-alanine ligase
MKVFSLKSDLISYLGPERSNGMKIGFVPTMGALHEGHLALIRASKKEADCTVCSIFVNPTQFNNRKDFLKYPVSLSEDMDILKIEGCNAVYAPGEDDLYDPPGVNTVKFNFGKVETILEGKYRPEHFNGVALIVTKLFNIVQPHFTYFGQKDLQQYFIVRQLIHDLCYNIQLRLIPTVREKDGLAQSSRNRRIPENVRPEAALFYKSLITGRDMLHKGSTVNETKEYIKDMIEGHPGLQLEYFEVVDTEKFTLTDQINNKNNTALCIAGYINNIRLIDNIMYI